MKESKSNQEKGKRNAEDWVLIARNFGEKCVKIQKDSKLNIDQKLEKQRTLCNEMVKEIQEDPHLSEADKNQMAASVNNYMEEWQTMHDLIQKAPQSNDSSNKKKN